MGLNKGFVLSHIGLVIVMYFDIAMVFIWLGWGGGVSKPQNILEIGRIGVTKFASRRQLAR